MMAGLDEFNDDKGCNRRDDVQKSRQSFEHVTRMNQGVERKRYCHKNHPDLYNDEGSFGTEKVFPFDSSLGQKSLWSWQTGSGSSKKKSQRFQSPERIK